MGHYDLYRSIGLDPQASSSDLAAELARRLGENLPRNPGGADELQVARKILTDPQRRAFYDTVLADPNRPSLAVEGLRDIAAMSDFSNPPPPAQSPAASPATGSLPNFSGAAATHSWTPGPRPQSEQPTAQQAGPSHQSHPGSHHPAQPGPGQPAPGHAAPDHGAPDQATPGESGPSQMAEYKAKASATFNNAAEKSSEAVRHVSSNVHSQVGQLQGEYAKSSGKAIAVTAAATFLICLLLFGLFSLFLGRGDASEREAVSLAREFIAIEDAREARDWLRDHARSESFSSLTTELGLRSSSVDYPGFAPEFGLDDAEVVQVVDFLPFYTAPMSIEGTGWDEFLKEHDYRIHVVGIGDGHGDNPKVNLVFMEVGGEMRLELIREPVQIDVEEANSMFENGIESSLIG